MELNLAIEGLANEACHALLAWVDSPDPEEKFQPLILENSHGIPVEKHQEVHNEIIEVLNEFCENGNKPLLTQHAYVATAFSKTGKRLMVTLIPQRDSRLHQAYIGQN